MITTILLLFFHVSRIALTQSLEPVKLTKRQVRAINQNQIPPNLIQLIDLEQEGLFTLQVGDDSTADNTGIYLVTTNGLRYKRYVTNAVINIKWFGAKGDGITNNDDAWQKAKNSITEIGGTIFFPSGKYMSGKKGWQLHKSNIHLKGEGINFTFLVTPDNSDATGLELAPYRTSGWNSKPSQLYTYNDEVSLAQGYIDLKDGQNKSAFKPGTIFFICAGASYYDQHYGEFNIVKKLINNRIYLQHNLSKDYNSEKSSYYGTLEADFMPPSVSQTAIAHIQNPPKSAGDAISLGNDIYEVVSVSGNDITLKNLGKGNSSNIIPSGTKIFKSRAIIVTPSTTYNTIVEDLTIVGHRKSISISNSVKTCLNRVKLIWLSGVSDGGLWLDGDDGRDFTMRNSEVFSETLKASQFARSFTDVKILDSKFYQSSIDFTEFSANCNILNCQISILNNQDSRSVKGGITVGATTTNISVHNNQISVSEVLNAISSQPDIQVYNGIPRSLISVKDNIIKVNKCKSAIEIVTSGVVKIENNIITGSVESIFGSTSGVLYDKNSNQLNIDNKFLHSSLCYIKHNSFTGTTDSFSRRTDPANLIIEDNYINSLGEYTQGGNLNSRKNGNIIKSGNKMSYLDVEAFVFRNNTFKGWYYLNNSINYKYISNKNFKITNNTFIDNIGPFSKNKTIIFSVKDNNFKN